MRQRGFTLIELLITLAVTSVAIAAATSMLLSTTAVSTNTEQAVDADQGARVAQDRIDRLVRQAGLGASGGIWISIGGVPTHINAVFGADGAGTTLDGTRAGSDDLWLVEPSENAFRESCEARGAGTLVTASSTGGGTLQVSCTGAFAKGDLLLVSNMTSAALLTGTNPESSTTLSYAESATGFSDAPQSTGFQIGDWVYGASLVHFYVADDPATGRPALFEAKGKLAQDELGRPFTDVPGSAHVLQTDVEDLQVAYGVDASGTSDPSGYAFQSGLGSTFVANLKSVRVSVVTRTAHPLRSTNGDPALSLGNAAPAAENHSPSSTTKDGLGRSLLQRRVEVPNMATESL